MHFLEFVHEDSCFTAGYVLNNYISFLRAIESNIKYMYKYALMRAICSILAEIVRKNALHQKYL